MNIDNIPEFTAPAAKLWTAIPPQTRQLPMSNVWCSTCRHEVTITNFTCIVRRGDLLLVGLLCLPWGRG